jgi:hypothetical protein
MAAFTPPCAAGKMPRMVKFLLRLRGPCALGERKISIPLTMRAAEHAQSLQIRAKFGSIKF